MDTPLNFFNVPMYFVTFINGQEFSLSSHAKLITCPIELKPLRGNDRHV